MLQTTLSTAILLSFTQAQSENWRSGFKAGGWNNNIKPIGSDPGTDVWDKLSVLEDQGAALANGKVIDRAYIEKQAEFTDVTIAPSCPINWKWNSDQNKCMSVKNFEPNCQPDMQWSNDVLKCIDRCRFGWVWLADGEGAGKCFVKPTFLRPSLSNC